jgi:ribosomal protein S27E
MKQAIALLSWSLWVDCPECDDETICLCDGSDNTIAKAIFNNNWDNLKGHEVECPYCGKTFAIEKVEY